jgi:crotonobetainyl-CoA:carnitine CoA-transferase CaiB-like acyl-CoA transferase
MAFRVVDFTRVLAGPWATQILGDQGFDVVKIEALEGDETRRFLPLRDGESVYFACTNRNKRSVALDLKHPEGQRLARALIATADVVVENFRPGVMRRLGLDYAENADARTIWVTISAFGPEDEAAGYDLVLQSVGGIATLTGDPPQKAGPSIADLASAQTAVQAVLFALLERAETGRGKRIDIRMLDVQHALLAYYASAWLNAGQAPPAPSNAHPSIAPYNLYRCADGWLAVCCANDTLWAKLRDALALAERPEWLSLAGRVADRTALDAAITARLATRRVAEWERSLGAAGVPVGAALSVGDSLAHPGARQISVGTWTFPAPPLAVRQLRPPPRLGEHTRELLHELGVDAEEFERLGRAGAIRGSDTNL